MLTLSSGGGGGWDGRRISLSELLREAKYEEGYNLNCASTTHVQVNNSHNLAERHQCIIVRDWNYGRERCT